jgi:hypothetical protein
MAESIDSEPNELPCSCGKRMSRQFVVVPSKRREGLLRVRRLWQLPKLPQANYQNMETLGNLLPLIDDRSEGVLQRKKWLV